MSSSKRAHRRRVAAEERQIRRHFLRGVKFLGATVPPLPPRQERFGPIRLKRGAYFVLPPGYRITQTGAAR